MTLPQDSPNLKPKNYWRYRCWY